MRRAAAVLRSPQPLLDSVEEASLLLPSLLLLCLAERAVPLTVGPLVAGQERPLLGRHQHFEYTRQHNSEDNWRKARR